MNSKDLTDTEEFDKPRKQKFKRLHQERCGGARQEYDSYADVREACERKLAEWERQGILAPYNQRGNDWLFGGQ